MLKKCVAELRALYLETAIIIQDLLTSSAAEIIRSLCERFRVLQEYFFMRYHEARALAISALGPVEAAFSFP
jgi:hypothetical protein